MSDDHLRTLEHRWQASGDLHDEARYLAARVRSDQLNPSHLELAAYLGHGAAIAALGRAAPAGEHVPFARWATSIDPRVWDQVAHLLLAHATQALDAHAASPLVREHLERLIALLRAIDSSDPWRGLEELEEAFEQRRNGLLELDVKAAWLVHQHLQQLLDNAPGLAAARRDLVRRALTVGRGHAEGGGSQSTGSPRTRS